MALPDEPITRNEHYLAAIAGQEVELPEPITREDHYLDYIAEHGGGGGGETTKGYYYNGSFYSDAAHTQPITPETGKFYFDLSEGKTYVYDGTAFVMLDGETSDFDAAQMLYDTDFVNPVAKDDDTLFLNGDKILIY